MLKDYQKKLLELLEQLELEVSNLYKLFAEKFPTQKELWNCLHHEEIKHAAYINKLTSFAKEDLVIFDEKMTKTYTVQSVINDIKDKYNKTENNQYNIINALSFTLSLEQSIIEHKFYDYFSSKNPEAMTMIKEIKGETFMHEAKVKEALEAEKNKN